MPEPSTPHSTTVVPCPRCGRPTAPATLATPPAPVVREGLDLGGEGDTACPGCVQPVLDALLASGEVSFGEGGLPDTHADTWSPLPIEDRTLADDSCRGRGVTVAVVDSGFHAHPDLVLPRNRIRAHAVAREREVQLRPFTDAPEPWPDPSPPPPHAWHGLMTSAALAGNGALSDGRFSGLASESDLFLARIGTKAGKIGDRQIASGLRLVDSLADRFGIRVVNLSVGGDRVIPSLRSSVNRLVRRLSRRGITVVAAIGNSGQKRVVPPASSPEAITVGGFDDGNSLDPTRWKAWHSNFGPTPDGVSKPDLLAQSLWVAAPILPLTEVDAEAGLVSSLLPLDHEERIERLALAPEPWAAWARMSAGTLERWLWRRRRRLKLVHRAYQHVDGTSFAAPLVASAAARMLEEDPSLAPARLKRILMRTAVPLPGVPAAHQGAGVLRVGPAVAYVRRSKEFRSGGPSPQLDGRRVTFHLHAPGAETVRLHAEWREWSPDGVRFVRITPSVWRLSLPTPPSGHWRYRFAVDHGPWIRDPENPLREPDGRGSWNSVLDVP